MRGTRISLALSALLVLLQTSCLRDGTGPGNQSNDRLSIVNTPGALAARVTYYADSTVAIDAEGVGAAGLGGLKIVKVN